ncbi:MAG: hypothetical protein ACPGUV_09095 [Polyangiales bacterium]
MDHAPFEQPKPISCAPPNLEEPEEAAFAETQQVVQKVVDHEKGRRCMGYVAFLVGVSTFPGLLCTSVKWPDAFERLGSGQHYGRAAMFATALGFSIVLLRLAERLTLREAILLQLEEMKARRSFLRPAASKGLDQATASIESTKAVIEKLLDLVLKLVPGHKKP